MTPTKRSGPVLLVEDDMAIAKLLLSALREEEFRVTYATSGEAAIAN